MWGPGVPRLSFVNYQLDGGHGIDADAVPKRDVLDIPSLREEAPPSSRRGRPAGRFTQHKRMRLLRQLLHTSPKGITLGDIAKRLHVTTRSARRYIRELGDDVEAIPERPGGEKLWRIPPVDQPRRVLVRRTQAYALLATRGLFEPMRGSTLYEEIGLAAQTLLGVARRPGRGPNAVLADAKLEQRFRYLPFAPKDYTDHAETLDTVFQAVSDLRPLRCRCAQGMRLTIHPYALLFYKDAIHCLAFDPEQQLVRTLPIDGISNARCLDEPRFDIPEDFDVDDYVQGQFGLWRSDGPCKRVVIDLDASISDYALTRSVHPSQVVEQLGDGNVRLSFDIADLTEVTSWILGFGSLAKVVAPTELIDAVRAQLQQALDRYR